MICFKRNVVAGLVLLMVTQLQAIDSNDVTLVLNDTWHNVANSELSVALGHTLQNAQNWLCDHPTYTGCLAGFVTFLICMKLWRQHVQNRTFKEINEGYMQGFNNGYNYAYDEQNHNARRHNEYVPSVYQQNVQDQDVLLLLEFSL